MACSSAGLQELKRFCNWLHLHMLPSYVYNQGFLDLWPWEDEPSWTPPKKLPLLAATCFNSSHSFQSFVWKLLEHFWKLLGGKTKFHITFVYFERRARKSGLSLFLARLTRILLNVWNLDSRELKLYDKSCDHIKNVGIKTSVAKKIQRVTFANCSKIVAFFYYSFFPISSYFWKTWLPLKRWHTGHIWSPPEMQSYTGQPQASCQTDGGQSPSARWEECTSHPSGGAVQKQRIEKNCKYLTKKIKRFYEKGQWHIESS